MLCCLNRLPNAFPEEVNSSAKVLDIRSNRQSAVRYRGRGLLFPGRRLDLSCRAAPTRMKASAPQHLIIESNGLFGHPQNWEVMNKYLERKLDTNHYLIHASQVNQLTQTFDGIDSSGDRLASEIEALVHANPSLKYISMLGHSMGGLLVRYAAGQLYAPDNGLMAGRLEPIHFITMATPHLGCDVQGESQVPMLGLVTPFIKKTVADSLAVNVSKAMLGRTGPQFMMEDRDHEQWTRKDALASLNGNSAASVVSKSSTELGVNSNESSGKAPLLARLAFDVAGEASYYGALKAFWSRTCYGNMSGDHLVGWANSTLRYTDELPNTNLNDRTELPEVKGVIREDPTQFAQTSAPAAGDARNAPTNQQALTQHSVLRQALEPAFLVSQINSKGAQKDIDGAAGASSNGIIDSFRPDEGNGKAAAQGTTEEEVAMKFSMEHIPGMPRETLAAVVLARLRSLPWARVDCAWRDAQVSMFAHNNIQVTRGWLNWDVRPHYSIQYGESVCGHLTDRFLAMEQQLAQNKPDYVVPSAGSTPGQNTNSSKGN